MATLKVKFMSILNILRLKELKKWKLFFRVPKIGISGLPYLQMGWANFFKNYIHSISRVPKQIPNLWFWWLQLLDLEVPLELCGRRVPAFTLPNEWSGAQEVERRSLLIAKMKWCGIFRVAVPNACVSECNQRWVRLQKSDLDKLSRSNYARIR